MITLEPLSHNDRSQTRVPAPPEEARSLGSLGPMDVRSVVLTGILVLLVFYTLYFARGLFLPVILALLLDFLLTPVVRALKTCRVPEMLGAGLVILALLGGVVCGIYLLSEPAQKWMKKAPWSFYQIESKLKTITDPVQDVKKATREVEQRISDMTKGEAAQSVEIKEPGLSETLFVETQEFVGGAAVMFVLLFLLLSSGDLFLRRLVRVLPRLENKKMAVEIIRQIESDISTYLFTVTWINAALGCAIALGMYVLGMPNPLLWGVMAGLLNFIPYIGALVGIIAVFFVAMLTFDHMGFVLLIPAFYLGLNIVEAYIITPLVLSRRLTLNPVVIFVWLLLWGWLWGVAGALMAVPLLAVVKIVCDRIKPLQPLGEFLGQ